MKDRWAQPVEVAPALLVLLLLILALENLLANKFYKRPAEKTASASPPPSQPEPAPAAAVSATKE